MVQSYYIVGFLGWALYIASAILLGIVSRDKEFKNKRPNEWAGFSAAMIIGISAFAIIGFVNSTAGEFDITHYVFLSIVGLAVLYSYIMIEWLYYRVQCGDSREKYRNMLFSARIMTAIGTILLLFYGFKSCVQMRQYGGSRTAAILPNIPYRSIESYPSEY